MRPGRIDRFCIALSLSIILGLGRALLASAGNLDHLGPNLPQTAKVAAGQTAQVSWIPDLPIYDSEAFIDNPTIAAAGAMIFVAFQGKVDDQYQIFFISSRNGGIGWSTPQAISNSGSSAIKPRIFVDREELSCYWIDNRNGRYELFATTSQNWGQSWDLPLLVTDKISNNFNVSYAQNGANLYLAWQDYRHGNDEIYFAASANGGRQWQPDQRITDNYPESSYPALASTDRFLYLTWQNWVDGAYEIYFTRSPDHGHSFEQLVRRLTVTGTDPYEPARGSFKPAVGCNGQQVLVVWADYVQNNFELFFKKSYDYGATFADAQQLTKTITRSYAPGVAISGEISHLIWLEDLKSKYTLFYKRELLASSSRPVHNDNTANRGYDDDGALDYSWHYDGIFDHFAVFVSINQGPFNPLTKTKERKLQFPGDLGTSYRIKVAAVDVAGNVGMPSPTSRAVIVDSRPPRIKSSYPMRGEHITDRAPVIELSMEDDQLSGLDSRRTMVFIDGRNVSAAATISQNHISYPLPLHLDGPVSAQVDLYDQAGNVHNYLWTFHIDTTPPLVVEARTRQLTNLDTTTIYGSYLENNLARILVEPSGALAVIDRQNERFTVRVPLKARVNSLALIAQDMAGNIGTSQVEVLLDNTPPRVVTASPPDGAVPFNPLEPIIVVFDDLNGSGMAPGSLRISINGQDRTAWAKTTAGKLKYIPDLPYGGDRIRYQVSGQDMAGNTTVASGSFTLDRQPPQMTLDPHPDAVTVATYNFTGSYIEENIAAVRGYPGGIAAGLDEPQARYRLAMPLEQGHNQIKLVTSDKSGRLITMTTAIYCDSWPPQISEVLPGSELRVNTSRPTISAKFSDSGTGVNLKSIKLVINSIDMTAHATMLGNKLLYSPSLPYFGRIHIVLEVADNSGNKNVRSWYINLPEE